MLDVIQGQRFPVYMHELFVPWAKAQPTTQFSNAFYRVVFQYQSYGHSIVEVDPVGHLLISVQQWINCLQLSHIYIDSVNSIFSLTLA